MKRFLIFTLFLSGLGSAFGQNPQINGNLMLCPWTDGTASVSNPIYDTYQWYSKLWFTSDEYVAIPGADQASFTYDWYNYDQSLFKVVVTLDGQTFESNEIQIDSFNWVNMTVFDELNETVSYDWDAGHYLLCQGGSFNVIVNSPYTVNIQWYKNGVPIPGANEASYQISGPGTYHVEAAPEVCPGNTSTNEGLPIVVADNLDCNLAIGNPISIEDAIKIYPNPASNSLFMQINNDVTITEYSIIESSGKVVVRQAVQSGQSTSQIDVSHLSNGFYIIKIETTTGSIVKKFIKN